MNLIDCSPADEIFTHRDPATGELRTFNVTKMYDYATQIPGAIECLAVDIDADFVEFIRRHRGIEQWKLDRLQEPFLSRPTIMVDLPDGSQLTVDGHHRWVRQHELGHTVIRCYRFTPGQWEPFLIEDLPQEEMAKLL